MWRAVETEFGELRFAAAAQAGRPRNCVRPRFELAYRLAFGAHIRFALAVRKRFILDGECLAIGSMNFNNRSMALNDESTLTVLDRRIGVADDRLFLDDLQHATEITAAEFRRRSLA